MDNTFQSPVILSLCTGMRGLERGIEKVLGELRVAAYVEIEAFIVENLVQQMEQGVLAPAPIWTDVKTFPRIAQKLRNKVDILTGGYPCQPFSHVGKRRGVTDPRHIWPYIAEIIYECRPAICFFENVSNHINLGYREVRYQLEDLDYSVKEGIFSAEEVGAPHIRKRLFILAVDNTIESRLEGYAGDDSGAKGRKGSIGSIAPTSFPLGQGYDQLPWESPRVESCLGYTVNGYNYREDLLRMAGNAVVPQQAEKAFRTLILRFLRRAEAWHPDPAPQLNLF